MTLESRIKVTGTIVGTFELNTLQRIHNKKELRVKNVEIACC